MIFSFSTDTATLAVFDLDALKRRVKDTCDWWSIIEDELLEKNKGNIACFGLGQDGRCDIEILTTYQENVTSLKIFCPSEKVFIGSGDDISGGELSPMTPKIFKMYFLKFAPEITWLNARERKRSESLFSSFDGQRPLYRIKY
ncbi:DUF6386 family protein [Pseudomonas syringae]|jgi:hypothetical protein|uniref:DUF6386 family protein n=1 Tax=Pseudomonas syringae TaxID=317 RepID=UPI000AB9362A|nr:DUF6386 family protein [Pseudomonas syringae]